MELGLQGSALAEGIHTATQPPFPRKQPLLQGTQREAAGGQQRPKQAHTSACLCACVCVCPDSAVGGASLKRILFTDLSGPSGPIPSS